MNYSPGSPAAQVLARGATSVKARADGKRRVRNGNEFEAIADDLHKQCADKGVAHVDRVNSHIKIVARMPDGYFKAVVTGPSCIDCVGRLTGGRAVAVEVKGVELAFDEKRKVKPVVFPLSNVKQHQADWLDASARDGALTLLLVIYGGTAFFTAYAVPWSEVRASGLRTLTEPFLAPWKIKPGVPYLRRSLTAPSSPAPQKA